MDRDGRRLIQDRFTQHELHRHRWQYADGDVQTNSCHSMNRKSQRGFTLIELIMACAISMLIVLSLISTFIHQRRAYKSMQQLNETDQNIRAALDMVARDARSA